jgi:hypothetical protein
MLENIRKIHGPVSNAYLHKKMSLIIPSTISDKVFKS